MRRTWKWFESRAADIDASYERTGGAEQGHRLEDLLARDVLREIAEGNPNGRGFAQAMVDILETKRTRWYA